MAKKFIINDGDLILGHVKYHENLVTGDRERDKTIGGGFWHHDRNTNVMWFWGTSRDFGNVTKKQFDDAIKEQIVEDSEIYFSSLEYYSDVRKEIEKNVTL